MTGEVPDMEALAEQPLELGTSQVRLDDELDEALSREIFQCSLDLLQLALGLDQGWRRRTARELRLGPGSLVLDLATGTGDLAIVIAREHPEARVIGVDPSSRMLEVAERKVREAGLEGRIELRQGDAQALDLPDASVSAVRTPTGMP